jgi:hypothetical protein
VGLGVKSLFLTFGKNLGTGLKITHFPLSITYREAIYGLNSPDEIFHVPKPQELRQCVKYRTNLISRLDWQN